MAKVKPRAKVPSKAAPGEVVTIKTLISHPMETGLRKDRDTGETIPRQIIHTFTASFDGQEVVTVELDPAVSANPYLEFDLKVPEDASGTGTVRFEWQDDDGSLYELEETIEIA